MSILTKTQFQEILYQYYIEHYGEQTSDKWYDQPAVNVWVFSRDGKIITLKSHVLTGEVSEQIEEM